MIVSTLHICTHDVSAVLRDRRSRSAVLYKANSSRPESHHWERNEWKIRATIRITNTPALCALSEAASCAIICDSNPTTAVTNSFLPSPLSLSFSYIFFVSSLLFFRFMTCAKNHRFEILLMISHIWLIIEFISGTDDWCIFRNLVQRITKKGAINCKSKSAASLFLWCKKITVLIESEVVLVQVANFKTDILANTKSVLVCQF